MFFSVSCFVETLRFEGNTKAGGFTPSLSHPNKITFGLVSIGAFWKILVSRRSFPIPAGIAKASGYKPRERGINLENNPGSSNVSRKFKSKKRTT
jgi:hypothetical protein